jgi:hypothetical protein
MGHPQGEGRCSRSRYQRSIAEVSAFDAAKIIAGEAFKTR